MHQPSYCKSLKKLFFEGTFSLDISFIVWIMRTMDSGSDNFWVNQLKFWNSESWEMVYMFWSVLKMLLMKKSAFVDTPYFSFKKREMSRFFYFSGNCSLSWLRKANVWVKSLNQFASKFSETKCKFQIALINWFNVYLFKYRLLQNSNNFIQYP